MTRKQEMLCTVVNMVDSYADMYRTFGGFERELSIRKDELSEEAHNEFHEEMKEVMRNCNRCRQSIIKSLEVLYEVR